MKMTSKMILIIVIFTISSMSATSLNIGNKKTDKLVQPMENNEDFLLMEDIYSLDEIISPNTLTKETETNSYNYIEKNRQGSNFAGREGSVEVEGSNAHIGEGAGKGSALYAFFVGKDCSLSDLILEIEYKDTGWFGNGPSIYLLDFSNSQPDDDNWQCVAENIGKASIFKKWSKSISQPDNYHKSSYIGYLLVSIKNDIEDDTFIKNVKIKFDYEIEPTIVYDALIGFAESDPGSAWDIPPYSNHKLTVKLNPDFDDQTILVPHNGENLWFFFFGAVSEDAPTFPVREEWTFTLEFNGGLQTWGGWWWLIEDQGVDDSFLGLFGSEEFVSAGNDCTIFEAFYDGEHSYRASLEVKFLKYLPLEDGEYELIDVYSESKTTGKINIKIINNKPSKPTIEGPSNVKPGETAVLKGKSIDSDGDKIQYGWDFNNDDNVDKWTDEFDSGVYCSVNKKWDEKGEYTVKVKARDNHFKNNKYYSEWSDPFTIKVQKSKSRLINQFLNGSIFERLLENFNIQ